MTDAVKLSGRWRAAAEEVRAESRAAIEALERDLAASRAELERKRVERAQMYAEADQWCAENDALRADLDAALGAHRACAGLLAASEREFVLYRELATTVRAAVVMLDNNVPIMCGSPGHRLMRIEIRAIDDPALKDPAK